jgi:phenylpropionate dioxygenase-like ring-hydroxylating dioxygenase large terminal subunit
MMNELTKILPAQLDGDIRKDFIPKNRWTDPELFTLEKERIWPRIWHIACREEEIPDVGDYITYEVLDESIILVRTGADTIKAYYNVCQHRGRRLVNPGKGRTSGFFCGFHGWKWDLQGENTHVFHEEEWAECPEFTKESIHLKEPRVDRFAGWAWVNIDPHAEPLRDWLGPVVGMLEPFQYEGLRRAWHETIIAPVNWKVVVEAFHEGYHSGATHNSSVDYFSMRSPTTVFGNHAGFGAAFPEMPRMKRENGKWTLAESGADMLYYQSKELHETLFAQVSDPVMKAISRLRDEFPVGSDESALFPRFMELQREEIEATGAIWPETMSMEALFAAGISIHIFPNTIVLPTIDAVLWYRMRPHPERADMCIFDIWSLNRYAPGEEPVVQQHISNGFDEARGRNPFLEQDFNNMRAVELGMRSRGWAGARTNPAEETTVTHFHKMLDKFYAMPPLD